MFPMPGFDEGTESDSTVATLLRLNQQLLDAIASGDWDIYEKLCDPALSAFEPEARGQLVEGMDFHRFYFDLPKAEGPCTTTMSSPHIRLMGDVAVISCVRLVQRLDADGQPVTGRSEETRVWHRAEGQWRHVHFHRSTNV